MKYSTMPRCCRFFVSPRREEGAYQRGSVTDEQRRQTAQSVLALRVASFFRFSCVARRLSRHRGTGIRPPRALERRKMDSNAAKLSTSSGS